MTFEEFLKSIDGLTDEQVSAITGGMKENKLYISKEENIDERYTRLKGQHDDASAQLADAQKLIDEMKAATANNEGLQAKVSDYEQKIAEAEERAAKAERDADLKVKLLASGAVPEDVDYLMWRIDNGEVEVKSDKDGKLSGVDEAITALKASCPKNFTGKESIEVEGKPLPKPDGEVSEEPQSLEDALRQNYEKNQN